MKVEMESSFPWEGEVKVVISGIAAEGMQSEISSGNGNAAAGGCSAARKEAENRFDVVEEAAAGDSFSSLLGSPA